jgi:hypothetical protein
MKVSNLEISNLRKQKYQFDANPHCCNGNIVQIIKVPQGMKQSKTFTKNTSVMTNRDLILMMSISKSSQNDIRKKHP